MTDLTNFRPLLSAKIVDVHDEALVMQQLKKCTYPMIGSPKVDGIRVLIHPEKGAVTRKLISVPNLYIQKTLNSFEYHFLDGEIVVGGHSAPQAFNTSQSGVMSHGGDPDFAYWVFDHFETPDTPYETRLETVKNAAEIYDKPFIKVMPYAWLENPDEVLAYEDVCLKDGYEGIMLRSPQGRYKFNRATFNQQQLIKLKRTTDEEATIVGFEQIQRNTNTLNRDELGQAKRSSHQSGMVTEEILGNFLCRPGASSSFTEEFSVGSGLDDAMRSEYWSKRDQLLGTKLTYRYQKVGSLNKPRFPIFKGLRLD